LKLRTLKRFSNASPPKLTVRSCRHRGQFLRKEFKFRLSHSQNLKNLKKMALSELMIPEGSIQEAINLRATAGQWRKLTKTVLHGCGVVPGKRYEYLELDEALNKCGEMPDCFGIDYYGDINRAWYCFNAEQTKFKARKKYKTHTHFYIAKKKKSVAAAENYSGAQIRISAEEAEKMLCEPE